MNHVVVALDSFKGSLSARRATAAVARGLRRRASALVVHEHPVADGGDGTLDALATAGFTSVPVTSTDPLGRPVEACYASRDGVAVVELAVASGLGLVADVPLTAQRAAAASTYGTGQVIAAALDAGHRTVVVGLGGSATTDGGSGLLAALGVRLFDADGAEADATTSPLNAVRAVDMTGLHPSLTGSDRVELVVASDVDNPLLGAHGAAAVYGPQKGADAVMVADLDAALTRWADLLHAATGVDAASSPGAGAAGGAGFALFTLGAHARRGIDLVLELTGLAHRLTGARLVVTGEGRLDHQTLRGKAPAGVAAAARQAGATVVAAAGSCALDLDELAAAGFARAFTLTDLEPDTARCHDQAEPLLERLGEDIAATLPNP
ncbi:glycerate kinase [Saccharothrix ecbatanensis]|uniref:Glycerate kinase n=1 Tax=Saccharothrix ecbatanensis TaxID=1105145 RepID=A0A7W9HK33_9PSEU|nr:glycerate kinase [Saccharothrix ecbatanensis]MBB5803747.1 glycerate kinase [Saccharothrix ecbatanensis]